MRIKGIKIDEDVARILNEQDNDFPEGSFAEWHGKDLTLEEKQQVLIDGFHECMKHHLSGNYISMSDIEGLEYSDIEWFVNTDRLQMVALTEFGPYHYQYDYDFSFDDNLNAFIEGLQDFLMSEIDLSRLKVPQKR